MRGDPSMPQPGHRLQDPVQAADADVCSYQDCHADELQDGRRPLASRDPGESVIHTVKVA